LPNWLGQLRACPTLARRLRLNPAGRDPTRSPEAVEPVNYYEQQALEGRRDEPEPN